MRPFLYFLGLALPSLAEATTGAGTYTLLAPLSGYLTGAPDLTTYLQGFVQMAIGIAGVLAVIMIVYCGVQLMGTPSASGKSEAKECIWNAISGVLLALGAWGLLYTINPLLLTSELNLTEVVVAPGGGDPSGPKTDPYPTKTGWYFKYSDAGGIHYNPAGNSAQTCAGLLAPAEASGKTILEVNGQKCFEVTNTPLSPSEAAARTTLCGNISCVGSTPVGINVGPCPRVGARGCTNVGGLGSAAVNAIRSLPGACGCNIVISGGTEYWLHGNKSLTPPNTNAAHAPGNDVFDLKKSTQLDREIKTGTQKTSFQSYSRWLYNGFWYTDEGSHWHACKNGLAAFYCKG